MGKWAIQINVTGVKPLGSFTRFQDGFYKGLIVDSEPHVSKKGGNSIQFDVDCTDAPHAGARANLYLNQYTPGMKDEDVVKKAWRGALESISVPKEKLDANMQLNLTDEGFKGKVCHFRVQNPPAGEKDEQGRDKLPNINFCTPEEYEKGRKAGAVAQGAQTAAGVQGQQTNGAVVSTPQPNTAGLEKMLSI